MPRRSITDPLPTPALVVQAGPTGQPVYMAKWRHKRPDGTTGQVKRKLGPAWLTRDPSGEWVKRKGRPADGYLDERAATVAAADLVAEIEAELTAADEAEHAPATFRQVAHSFLEHGEHVDGRRPSTLTDYRSMLAEPGTPGKRPGVLKDDDGNAKLDRDGNPLPKVVRRGLVMKRLGDLEAAKITTRQINATLDAIEQTGVSNRTVNKYRAVLQAVFNYGCRPSTFGLPANPVKSSPRRRQPPPARVEWYSREEVELLARTLAQRTPHAAAPTVAVAADPAQDAELVRIAAYTGLRRGELVALRWRDVHFAGRTIHVAAAVSGGQEVDAPKSGKSRLVALSDDAAAALDRLSQRRDFTAADDYVAVRADGQRLDPDAFGRRVKTAQKAAGLPQLGVHGLRHTFASQLVAGGLGLTEVQAAMGHSHIETTGRYLHARPATAMADAFTKAQRAGSTPGISTDRQESRAGRQAGRYVWRPPVRVPPFVYGGTRVTFSGSWRETDAGGLRC